MAFGLETAVLNATIEEGVVKEETTRRPGDKVDVEPIG